MNEKEHDFYGHEENMPFTVSWEQDCSEHRESSEAFNIVQVACIAQVVANLDEAKSDEDAEASNAGGTGSRHTIVSTLGISYESNGTSGVDQMEEISQRLTNFRISKARKTSRIGIQRTPLNLIRSFKHQALAGDTKDKENTPIVKTEQSCKHNVQKSAMSSCARRPLQKVHSNK